MEVRYEVAGLVLPARIGGHPGLDLCNTYAGWGEPPRGPGGDYLTSYAHLAQWVGEAGLVTGADVRWLRAEGNRHPVLASRELRRALELRAAVYAVVTSPVGTQRHTAALHVVTQAAQAATARAELVVGTGWRAGRGIGQPLDAGALAAAALLSDVPLEEVHACPGDGCGWVFRDRPGRRRWCRMEWCGNRLKQRAHARRTRQSGPSRSARS